MVVRILANMYRGRPNITVGSTGYKNVKHILAKVGDKTKLKYAFSGEGVKNGKSKIPIHKRLSEILDTYFVPTLQRYFEAEYQIYFGDKSEKCYMVMAAGEIYFRSGDGIVKSGRDTHRLELEILLDKSSEGLLVKKLDSDSPTQTNQINCGCIGD
ncbi:hypothetical protein HN587_03075 [Candidatus Woesearchaeota archaeon]|jgi:hypothetical protein|nr:hypothetical protein [Candidatus Woesearchaeota archaeon]